MQSLIALIFFAFWLAILPHLLHCFFWERLPSNQPGWPRSAEKGFRRNGNGLSTCLRCLAFSLKKRRNNSASRFLVSFSIWLCKVASVAIGANYKQTVEAFAEAEKYETRQWLSSIICSKQDFAARSLICLFLLHLTLHFNTSLAYLLGFAGSACCLSSNMCCGTTNPRMDPPSSFAMLLALNTASSRQAPSPMM